jgi:hypothetical protein
MTEAIERTWMKKCCGLCPFGLKGTLWLHPRRAEDFAYMASNPYSDFPCHKTAEYEEETEYSDGGYVHGEHSFTCHGFKALQVNCNREVEGFTYDEDEVFSSPEEMIEHHTNDWIEKHPNWSDDQDDDDLD